MRARSAPDAKRIGAELAFIPADAAEVLRKAFPNSEIKDALFVLERLRRGQNTARTRHAAHRLGRGDRFNGGSNSRSTAPAPPRTN